MRTLIFISASALLCLAAAAGAETLPQDPDAWSEYGNAVDAMSDGWDVECGLHLAIIVSDDCCQGERAVGAQCLVAAWCDPLYVERSVPLAGATRLRYSHKETWSEGFYQASVIMTASPEEILAGYDQKKVIWNFIGIATAWTPVDLAIADGEWYWREAGSDLWSPTGGNTDLTELVAVQWSVCNYWTIELGDTMLIDGLHFLVDGAPVAPSTWSAVKALF